MKKVELGKTGVKVSQQGLGLMGMSEFYGVTDDEESLKVINLAIDSGINFLDTSDMYGKGKNEELLAQVLKTRRSEVFVCTKFGIVRESNGSYGVNAKPEYVKQCVEASLKRLGIDYIDLYYLHRMDPATPIEETMGALAELVKEGKIKYIGLSECSDETLRRAHKVHPVTAVQSEYSLFSLDHEAAVIPTCKELGISFVAYSPLGRGFLSGRYRKPEDFDPTDLRKWLPRFQPENFAENLRLVDEINKIGEKKGATPSQIALAWIHAQGDHIISIPGTKKVKNLQENIGADKVHLTPEEVKHLGDIARSFPTKGARYPEWAMKSVNI